jgi:hypothetical protein
MTVGAAGSLTSRLDEDALGDPASDGDGHAGIEVADEDRAAENPGPDQTDTVADVESEGEQPPALSFAALDVGDPSVLPGPDRKKAHHLPGGPFFIMRIILN